MSITHEIRTRLMAVEDLNHRKLYHQHILSRQKQNLIFGNVAVKNKIPNKYPVKHSFNISRF